MKSHSVKYNNNTSIKCMQSVGESVESDLNKVAEDFDENSPTQQKPNLVIEKLREGLMNVETNSDDAEYPNSSETRQIQDSQQDEVNTDLESSKFGKNPSSSVLEVDVSEAKRKKE